MEQAVFSVGCSEDGSIGREGHGAVDGDGEGGIIAEFGCVKVDSTFAGPISEGFSVFIFYNDAVSFAGLGGPGADDAVFSDSGEPERRWVDG